MKQELHNKNCSVFSGAATCSCIYFGTNHPITDSTTMYVPAELMNKNITDSMENRCDCSAGLSGNSDEHSKVCSTRLTDNNKDWVEEAKKEEERKFHRERVKKWRKENPERAKAIKLKYRLKNFDKVRAYSKKYYEEHKNDPKYQALNNKKTLAHYYKNKEKWRARDKVHKAVKSGKLKKPLVCECCLGKKKLEGHHTDYKKPLLVNWLCKLCHETLHRTQHLKSIHSLESVA